MSDLKNNQCHIQLFEVKLTRLELWVAIVYDAVTWVRFTYLFVLFPCMNTSI